MKRVIATLAFLMLPDVALAQAGSNAAYVNGRLDSLQQQISQLSAQIEQLKAQGQQTQQRLESMRATIETRLERLEKGNASPGKAKGR
jgi:TolA-binding protein